jgi:hypothetical protein
LFRRRKKEEEKKEEFSPFLSLVRGFWPKNNKNEARNVTK